MKYRKPVGTILTRYKIYSSFSDFPSSIQKTLGSAASDFAPVANNE